MGNWVDEENSRFEREERNRIENAKPADFIKIDDGDIVQVSIDISKEPKMIEVGEGKYPRHSFGTVEPAGKHIDMTDKLYETFCKTVRGKNGIVKVNIGRTGTSKKTKWTVKVV